MNSERTQELRLKLHDLRLKQTIESRTGNALADVERIIKQVDVNEKEDFENCATISLVFLFGQESVNPSEETDYGNPDNFHEQLDELASKNGLVIERASSSGRFLELLESDSFRGALFFTAGKHRISHVFAARSTYRMAESKVARDASEFVKRFVVIDTARKGLIEKNLEEMVELFAESYVAALEDGGYGRVVYILSSSEGADNED